MCVLCASRRQIKYCINIYIRPYQSNETSVKSQIPHYRWIEATGSPRPYFPSPSLLQQQFPCQMGRAIISPQGICKAMDVLPKVGSQETSSAPSLVHPVDLRERFQILALELLRLIYRLHMNSYLLNTIHLHMHPHLKTYQCQAVTLRPSQSLTYRSPMHLPPVRTRHQCRPECPIPILARHQCHPEHSLPIWIRHPPECSSEV